MQIGDTRKVEFDEVVFRIMVTAPDDSNLWPLGEKVRKDDTRPATLPTTGYNNLSSAIALRNAKELALKLETPIPTDFGWPVLWSSDEAYYCGPHDDRAVDHNDCPGMPERIRRDKAVVRFRGEWKEYLHLGDEPKWAPLPKTVEPGAPARKLPDHVGKPDPEWFSNFMTELEATEWVDDAQYCYDTPSELPCCAIKAPRSMVKEWLVVALVAAVAAAKARPTGGW